MPVLHAKLSRVTGSVAPANLHAKALPFVRSLAFVVYIQLRVF